MAVHRNGAELSSVVRGTDAQKTLEAFLAVFRESTKRYPELIVDLPHIGGSSVPYIDDWSGDGNGRRKIGF